MVYNKVPFDEEECLNAIPDRTIFYIQSNTCLYLSDYYSYPKSKPHNEIVFIEQSFDGKITCIFVRIPYAANFLITHYGLRHVVTNTVNER